MKIRKYENRNEVPSNDITLVSLDDIIDEIENIRDILEDNNTYFNINDLIKELTNERYD